MPDALAVGSKYSSDRQGARERRVLRANWAGLVWA